MAFPFPFSVTSGSKTKENLTSKELKVLRQIFIDVSLFAQPVSETGVDSRISEQLSQIARVLGHSAGNEPTIYDNGTSRSSAKSSSNTLTLQVERALTQVLGRAPGRGSDSFISALNSAFPTGNDGRVMTTPARSAVSLYSPDSEGLSGQLSVEQANLYRQAVIFGNDALKVLDGLQPFNPTADIDAVEALRSLIRSQIRSLIDEFGRLDTPRKERVENFLSALLILQPADSRDAQVIGGSLFQFGKITRLINFSSSPNLGIVPVTINDETQIAGYGLLISYVRTLKDIWQRYAPPDTRIETEITGRYSERLSRTQIMLPVISDSNASFMAAMDSVGFTESERRSDAALFTTLISPGIIEISTNETRIDGINITINSNVILPSMTVNDFDEWIERFTTLEAPSLLSTSGQFGLDFVTDQADTLFWTIASVLYSITPQKSDSNPNLHQNQSKLLGKTLSFERVQQTLSELVFQLNTLANLGVGSTSSNI
jgi:hypothetical protein